MIPDNYRLLGLVINTIPFEYTNNTVSTNYSSYVELADLTNLKASLEQQLTSFTDGDHAHLALTDDILFVTTMIENLTRATN